MLNLTTIQETIARQLHHTRPDYTIPGVTVAMRPNTDLGLDVVSQNPRGRRIATILYDAGWDWYDVKVIDEENVVTEHSQVYCDQLGALVWGEDANEFTLPMVQVTDMDGNVLYEG